MNIQKILKDAQTAAETASRAALDQLEAHGPKFSVHTADLAGNITSPSLGTMLDVCGGAYLTVPGNTQFVRELKKLGKNKDSHSNSYYTDNWSMWKSVYKGYQLSFNFSLQTRQERSIHVAAMSAALHVLSENGIPVDMKSYID